jgi:hypothetical protein
LPQIGHAPAELVGTHQHRRVDSDHQMAGFARAVPDLVHALNPEKERAAGQDAAQDIYRQAHGEAFVAAHGQEVPVEPFRGVVGGASVLVGSPIQRDFPAFLGGEQELSARDLGEADIHHERELGKGGGRNGDGLAAARHHHERPDVGHGQPDHPLRGRFPRTKRRRAEVVGAHGADAGHPVRSAQSDGPRHGAMPHHEPHAVVAVQHFQSAEALLGPDVRIGFDPTVLQPLEIDGQPQEAKKSAIIHAELAVDDLPRHPCGHVSQVFAGRPLLGRCRHREAPAGTGPVLRASSHRRQPGLLQTRRAPCAFDEGGILRFARHPVSGAPRPVKDSVRRTAHLTATQREPLRASCPFCTVAPSRETCNAPRGSPVELQALAKSVLNCYLVGCRRT